MTQHDFKFLLTGVALGLLALPLQAQENDAPTHWVTDDLTTWVRSGPTDGYRIVGTLTAGEPVTLLETSGDYSRVEDDEGDIAWVLTEELQDEPSARERLPELQSRVQSLSQRLESVDETWAGRLADMTDTLERRDSRIAELEQRNAALASEAESSRRTVRQLRARLETHEEDLLLRYFLYGGGVAGAGLLVGLIVPHLPRRRKKRDRWF